jgi:cytoskeletal protein RodZ
MNLTLGQRLRASRESRGLSLADAAHETRIPAQRLRNLEEDNFPAFGSLTYARSFLKLYSDFLEVDASETLDDLPTAVFGGPVDYRYLTESFGPWVRTPARERLSEPMTTGVRQIKSPLPAALAVFICVLVATGMFGKYVADSQRSVLEPAEVAPAPIPAGTATVLDFATESSVPEKVEEDVQVAIPVDPLTLVPIQRTYPVLQPGDGL